MAVRQCSCMRQEFSHPPTQIPASSDTVESEGRQMTIVHKKRKNPNPPLKRWTSLLASVRQPAVLPPQN